MHHRQRESRYLSHLEPTLIRGSLTKLNGAFVVPAKPAYGAAILSRARVH